MQNAYSIAAYGCFFQLLLDHVLRHASVGRSGFFFRVHALLVRIWIQQVDIWINEGCAFKLLSFGVFFIFFLDHFNLADLAHIFDRPVYGFYQLGAMPRLIASWRYDILISALLDNFIFERLLRTSPDNRLVNWVVLVLRVLIQILIFISFIFLLFTQLKQLLFILLLLENMISKLFFHLILNLFKSYIVEFSDSHQTNQSDKSNQARCPRCDSWHPPGPVINTPRPRVS